VDALLGDGKILRLKVIFECTAAVKSSGQMNARGLSVKGAPNLNELFPRPTETEETLENITRKIGREK
jgi:hypothetical protein